MTNEANDMSEETEKETPEEATADQQPAPDGPVDEAELQAEEDAAGKDDRIDVEEEDDASDGGDTGGDDPEILFEGPDRLGELEQQVADLNDKLLRAVAETENVRRRSQKEKEDASKYAIVGFASDMISVADNLSRALESIDADTRAGDETVDNLMAGVEMTLSSLLTTFERTGIKRIEAMDQPFDHNLHEAMFEFEDPGKPAGTVFQVVQEGYTIRDRLLRPTKVGVTKGGPKGAPAADQSAPEPSGENAPEQTRAYEQGARGPGANLDEEL